MKTAVTLLALATGGATLPAIQGARLQPGSACFSVMAGDRAIGTTAQTITASREGRRRTWDVVVHQKLATGSFDMRDHFVLERATLLPIWMDSQRVAKRTGRGWQRIDLTYAPDRVRGTRETAAGTVVIDTPLTGPT